MFEMFTDPTLFAGFATLVLLEVILGVDNLVFIAILADKLPPAQRDKARILGLGLALGMRLILLASISWLATLTDPLFTVFDHAFSGRDLILFLGGLFLLTKATKEIHHRLEGVNEHTGKPKYVPAFWVVITQIVVLDAVFSLDAVITAVGMTHHLPTMMMAVIVAMGIMMWASKPLTTFVNAHPTIVMLCLGFLLLVGFSLVADGLGFHIPKGYLYAAIGFSILIEGFNQTRTIKHRKRLEETVDFREKTADAVMRLLKGSQSGISAVSEEDMAVLLKQGATEDIFKPEEEKMIRGVLSLSERDVRSIMTPRPELHWIDVEEPLEQILKEIEESSYSRLLVCRGNIDEIEGVINKDDLLSLYIDKKTINLDEIVDPPLTVHESTTVLRMIDIFREHPKDIAIVSDEYGGIVGVVTHMDVLGAIAGTMPHEAPEASVSVYAIEKLPDGARAMDGMTPIEDVREDLELISVPEGDFSTVAGLILYGLQRVPKTKDFFDWEGWRFIISEMDGRRIKRVRAERMTHVESAADSAAE